MEQDPEARPPAGAGDSRKPPQRGSIAWKSHAFAAYVLRLYGAVGGVLLQLLRHFRTGDARWHQHERKPETGKEQ